jgi:hypothetical protein
MASLEMAMHNKSLEQSAVRPFGKALRRRGKSRCPYSDSARLLNSMLCLINNASGSTQEASRVATGTGTVAYSVSA